MSLELMYKDELKGFYKSKVMLFLWTGLPMIAVMFHILKPEASQRELPLTMLSALVVSSLSGTLSSIMLAVSIIHEKSKGVYPLFLIRPVKRWSIVMGKYLAVYTCIIIAAFISVMIGLIVDYFSAEGITTSLLMQTGQSLFFSFSMMSVTASAGVLIGVVSPSVLVGVILVLYGGNQVAVVTVLPAMLNLPFQSLFSIGISLLVTAATLTLAIIIFNRKQF
ncbi:hypothetical protein ACFL4T_11385 [candidate division KSB1 bacterium]